jgi:hypothetical protein
MSYLAVRDPIIFGSISGPVLLQFWSLEMPVNMFGYPI